MSSSACEDVELYDDVVVGLDLGDSRLARGYCGELGLPIEAFLRLYAVRDRHVVARIDEPADLTSLVRAVSTADEALAFVRLFTNPSTIHLFGSAELILEVGPADLEPHAVESFGVVGPRVGRQGNGFIVVRELVSAASVGARQRLIRRTETVSTSGEYRHVGDDELGELEPGTVCLPYVE